MDYSNYRCPVCEKAFSKDDDIVVCPECGAPHHRECYEVQNRCFYDDKHAEGFDFRTFTTQPNNTNSYNYNNQNFNQNNNQTPNNPQTGDIIACLNCGTFNVSTNDVCQGCGAPLDKTNRYKQYDRHSTETQTPPPPNNNTQNPFSGGFVFDPMAGLKPEDDLGEGVTVSEVSKFTKNNSPFYCRLFNQIKNADRSRFSFVGFIFSGGWLLYRKMYKLGVFITTIMAFMIISQLFIQTFYADLMDNLYKILENREYNVILENLKTLLLNADAEDKLVLAVYAFSSLGQIALRVICAVCGNRWYYKHSIKTISKIKNNSGSKETADAAIEARGGVNGALAICLLITYSLLSFLPYFF